MNYNAVDTYSYVLADLLKRNSHLLGQALKRKGIIQPWTDEMKNVISRELRKYPINTKLISYSGWIWGRLMRQELLTREIYILLLQFAADITEKNLLSMYNDEYMEMLDELRKRIEEGADGKHKEVSEETTLQEWEKMKDYLPALHQMCEEWIKCQ
jgi:hypothetical protein